MIIDLSDDIRLASTECCWTLQRKRTRKSEQTYEAYKWFSSLRQALGAACEQEVRANPAHNLTEAAAAMSRITARYERLFDKAIAESAAELRVVG